MNFDLTEENEALAALIKRVEDKVAAAGYAPGVYVEYGTDTYKVMFTDVIYDNSAGKFRGVCEVLKWHERGYLSSWSEQLWMDKTTIVPNPEEQDG